jgi:hypothetical protein
MRVIYCDFCGKESEKNTSRYNEAKKFGRKMFCSKDCFYKDHQKHGKSNSREHISWMSMNARCNNKDHKKYNRYGGRGIKVCSRWEDFNNFLLEMGERPTGTTLGRIDNNKGYTPKNCRWETAKEQARNRRTSKKIMFKNKSRTIAEIAEITNFDQSLLNGRLRSGNSINEVIDENFLPKNKNFYVYKGEILTLKELEKISGIKHGTLRARLEDHNYTVEEAITRPIRWFNDEKSNKIKKDN